METKEIKSLELTASDKMVLTDGTHFVKAVLLPAGDDGSNWREVTAEEAMEMRKNLAKEKK